MSAAPVLVPARPVAALAIQKIVVPTCRYKTKRSLVSYLCVNIFSVDKEIIIIVQCSSTGAYYEW